MIIRSARLQDLPQVLQLFRRFFADTHCERDDSLPLDEATTAATFTSLIVTRFGNIIVAEDPAGSGTLMAVLAIQASPQFFGTQLVATELFWYVPYEFRGMGLSKLVLQEAEAWAKSIGATCILMGLHSSSPAHARQQYERYGYRESQTAFIKRLT